jgi:hypothetical protein
LFVLFVCFVCFFLLPYQIIILLKDTKAIGKTTRSTAEESTNTRTRRNMMGTGNRAKRRDLVYSFSQTARDMKVILPSSPSPWPMTPFTNIFSPGDFRDGVIEGKGIYYFADSSRYEGSWADHCKNGHGVYYFANGDIQLFYFIFINLLLSNLCPIITLERWFFLINW